MGSKGHWFKNHWRHLVYGGKRVTENTYALGTHGKLQMSNTSVFTKKYVNFAWKNSILFSLHNGTLRHLIYWRTQLLDTKLWNGILISSSYFLTLIGLQIRMHIWKSLFLYLIQNICCGYSKEPSHWEPKTLMNKKIIAIFYYKLIELLF